MNLSWRKTHIVLRGGACEDGTVECYLDYDLGSWVFGIRYEHNESWIEFNLVFGPISLTVMYWRLSA